MSTPLFAFFSQFPGFHYTQFSHPSDALDRLVALRYLWQPIYGSDKRRLRQAYRDALVQEFNLLFGTEVDDLAVWQNLCRRIGIEAPPTVKECHQYCVELISRTHVNLVDLVNAERNNSGVRVFPTVQALSDYSKDNGRIFPRHNIYAGDLLQYLLRHIDNPSQDDRRGEGGSRGRGGRGRRAGRGHGRGRAATIPNQ
ncbi:hypothetical protein D9619_011060 [Psilocybe cf. subviscida]|uniref:Uncharacterized protein n=1 Tax=Psilocybe cf. subviscida TaxID=2480587 RepID=A0A8H5B8U8_9AGAR|nr:hypothetical protein D9619_011060 [Psilocybe cf. subviscida]